MGRDIGPLTPEQAQGSLFNRQSRRVDRLRQMQTRFGMRPKRVFLTWTFWSGQERGEGDETIYAQVEILPTPVVGDITGILRNPRSGGYYEEGSVRVTEISTATYNEDMLRGILIPDMPMAGCPGTCTPVAPRGLPLRTDGVELGSQPKIDFFYQVVEDGRGGNVPERRRYRPASLPWRDAENFQFVILLERADEEMSRRDTSQIGPDDVFDVEALPP